MMEWIRVTNRLILLVAELNSLDDEEEDGENVRYYEEIRDMVTRYVGLHHGQLREAITILELALWKMKISQNGHQDMATHYSNIRSQDRVTCGADVVIGPVLKFLIATGDEIYDYDTEIEEGSNGEENLVGDEVRDSDIDLD